MMVSDRFGDDLALQMYRSEDTPSFLTALSTP